MIAISCNSLCIEIDHLIEGLNKEGRGRRWPACAAAVAIFHNSA